MRNLTLIPLLLGRGTAADAVAALNQERVPAAVREPGGRAQAACAGTDNERVITFTGHPRHLNERSVAVP